jgi:hypothetical protein
LDWKEGRKKGMKEGRGEIKMKKRENKGKWGQSAYADKQLCSYFGC